MAEHPKTFLFQKLVRDQTVPGYRSDPTVIEMSHRTLKGLELLKALQAKIHEEADEIPIVEEPTDEVFAEIVAEIADLEDVVSSLEAVYGVTDDMTRAASEKKAV